MEKGGRKEGGKKGGGEEGEISTYLYFCVINSMAYVYHCVINSMNGVILLLP